MPRSDPSKSVSFIKTQSVELSAQFALVLLGKQALLSSGSKAKQKPSPSLSTIVPPEQPQLEFQTSPTVHGSPSLHGCPIRLLLKLGQRSSVSHTPSPSPSRNDPPTQSQLLSKTEPIVQALPSSQLVPTAQAMLVLEQPWSLILSRIKKSD